MAVKEKKIIINKQIIQSRAKNFPKFGANKENNMIDFFRNNKYILNAKPFVKRVGGKRQIY